jgi:peptidoglycan/LPS O-acetylase OafA/YrhL
LTGIEASRGVASILVVLFHATGILNLPKYYGSLPLGGLFLFGYAGVDFFFVLSGFIIMFVHHDDIGDKGKLPIYALKRLLRVYPVYWAVSTLVIFAMLAFPSLGSGTPGAGFLLKSLFLLPQDRMPLVIVAWSLVHEMLFYAVFGLLIWYPRAGMVFMGVWSCGIVLRVFSGPEWNYNLRFMFHPHNVEFVLGMLVAALARQRFKVCSGILVAVGVALFLVLGVGDSRLRDAYPDLLFASYALSSCLVIFGLASGELACNFAAPRWLAFLGGASYSIYLVHFLALSLFAKLIFLSGFNRVLPVSSSFFVLVFLATVSGAAFHCYVEIPLNRVLFGRLLPSSKERRVSPQGEA